jgi:hypothetical protein
VYTCYTNDALCRSDCDAVANVEHDHHFTNTTGQTIEATLAAGMDIDCGSYFAPDLLVAWAQGRGATPNATRVALMDNALRRLLSVQFRLGVADPRSLVPYSNISEADVNTIEHQTLAKESAHQSFVLLRNENRSNNKSISVASSTLLPALPLSLDAPLPLRLAIIGPLANASTAMLGDYYGPAPYKISVLQGLSTICNGETNARTNGSSASSACTIDYASGNNTAAASAAAAASDVTIIVVGLDQQDEREQHDRQSLLLPVKQGIDQTVLARAVSAAGSSNGSIVVVLLMSGGPLDVSDLKASPHVDAIMWIGYGGQSGGLAAAEALFGVQFSFGRLPVTWMPEAFCNQTRISDQGMRPNITTGNPGRYCLLLLLPHFCAFHQQFSDTVPKHSFC